MADNHIPLNDPGIAGFATASYDGPLEPRFGEGVPTTTDVAVKSTSGITLPLYSVVNVAADGEITLAVIASGASNAQYITAEPIVLAAAATGSMPMYRGGYWEQSALNWDATFNTDAKKKTAFQGSVSPDIFIGKKKFVNSAINI